MSGMFKKPDTSAQERAIEETRKENARLKIQAEEERRELGEQAASKRMARLRGGSRMLLSAALADLAKTAVSKAETSAASDERQEILARRRARRGGRALLSEERLAPEAGVGQSTLGAGPMA